MRLRLVVVAAFVAMAVVPAYLRVQHRRPARPDAGLGGVLHRDHGCRTPVASLAWPKEALGLAATDTVVLWEQRDPSAAVAGLWSYDVRTQATERVLGRSATGKAAGFPSAVRRPDRLGGLGGPSRRRAAAHRGLRLGEHAPLDRRPGGP